MSAARIVSAVAVALAFAPVSGALADGGDGQSRVDVEVGKTVRIEVGIMRGLLCDDLTVVNAELRNKNEHTNVLVLTGLQEGVTSCRVGAVYPPFHLFEIHVVPPHER
jgi:hypothetical protein